MTARIVAYINQKGGVGKTTTVFHHARSACLRGLRVLLVDLDYQANLTSVTVGETYEEGQVGMADVLSTKEGVPMGEVIVSGIWPSLDVAPSNGMPLAGVQRELVAASAGREQRLRAALQPVVDDYDLILIDCRPDMDLLTINALVAADTAVVVTEAALFSINGLGQVLASVNEIRSYYNPNLVLAGVVLNKYEANTISGEAWRRDLVLGVEAHGVRLIQPIIPHSVAIRDSEEAAMGLDEWKSSRKAATLAAAYASHVDSIISEGAKS